MFLVYWTEVQDEVIVPLAKDFPATDMSLALQFSESLRARRRNGENIRFITMASENPNSVGEGGVGITDATYSWKKRRV